MIRRRELTLRILTAVFCFLLMQGLVGALAGVVLIACGSDISQMDGTWLGSASIISGTCAILVIWAGLKMIRIPDSIRPGNIFARENFWTSMSGLLGAVCCIIATSILSELLDLPDILEDQFMNMSTSIVGALSIGIVAPIVEELLFREGIEGYLLRNGISPRTAVLVSATVFGIFHLNPAQVPFAFAIGIALGVLYLRSRNIWLCGIIHILNNSVSVIMMIVMGEAAKDVKLTEAIGSLPAVAALTVACTAAGCYLLYSFCQNYKSQD